MNIELVVVGVPEPKGSFTLLKRGKSGGPRVMWGRGNGHQRLEEWSHRIRTGAQRTAHAHQIESPADGPLGADVTFYLPRPKSAAKRVHCSVRPDIDKLVRGAMDPLIGVLITEDSRIVSLSARKVYADDENPPGASIRIWSV